MYYLVYVNEQAPHVITFKYINIKIQMLSSTFIETIALLLAYYVFNRAVTNPKKKSDPDPNPNEVSCRTSDPDPIIHKHLYKT